MLWLGEHISAAHARAHHPNSGWSEEQRQRLYALNAAGLVSAGLINIGELVELMLDTGIVPLNELYIRHNALRGAVAERVAVLRQALGLPQGV